jgi:hypothetical protein
VFLLLAPAAGSASTPARYPSSARTVAGGGQALLNYLTAIDKARAPYLVAGPAADAALQKMSSKPDATWLTAAAKTRAAAQASAHLEKALKSMSPPTGLEGANRQLAESAQLAMQLLQQLTTALANKDVAAANAANASIPTVTAKIDALEITWRRKVVAAAKQAAVKVPSWVATLG